MLVTSSMHGSASQSETIDPVTGETREVSGNPFRRWSLELRRDQRASNLAWGVFVGRWAQGTRYSVRDTSDQSSNREWGAYVEWEPIDGLILRTNVDGPRTEVWRSTFFPAVRAPGLDPSFFASTTRQIDSSASFTVEWRRDHLEVRASFGTRPAIRTEEALTQFGAASGSLFATQVDESPRAIIRFRYFR